MPRGGARPGAGRKAGGKNKDTKAREIAAAKATKRIEKRIGHKAFDGDAHAYLMLVYKDPDCLRDERLKAALGAISYETPRLAAIEHTGKDGGKILISISKDDADLL